MRACPGFTLVELLAALAVAAILATVAVPGLGTLIENSQVTATTNQLIRAAYFTRMESLRLNETVTMCPSPDGRQCVDDAWERGWIVFRNPSRELQPADAETILLRDTLSRRRSLDITGNNPLRTYLSYNSMGISQRHSGAMQMGSILICGRTTGRRFVLNAGGRPRAELADC